jgi:hypothetical protein
MIIKTILCRVMMRECSNRVEIRRTIPLLWEMASPSAPQSYLESFSVMIKSFFSCVP